MSDHATRDICELLRRDDDDPQWRAAERLSDVAVTLRRVRKDLRRKPFPPDVQETIETVIDDVYEFALAHFLPDEEKTCARHRKEE